MGAEFVEVTVCPECGLEVDKLETKFQCEVCDTMHEDEDAAKLCCAEAAEPEKEEKEAEEDTD